MKAVVRILVSLGLCLAALSSYAKTQMPVAAYQLKQVDDFQQVRQVTGQVMKENEASLRFEFSGPVSQLLVEQGQWVKKGDILASQDARLLDSERVQVEANINKLNAQIKLAEQDQKRLESLSKSNYSAEQQLDQVRTELAVLKAEIIALEATKASISIRLEKTNIMAPFDGVIAQRLISLGEIAGPQTPAFVMLEQQQSQISMGIPQHLLGSIDEVMPVKIGGRIYQATRLNEGVALNPVTKTVSVKFTLPESAFVFSGQMATMRIIQTKQANGFWVPMSALADGSRGTWQVFLINEGILKPIAVDVLYSDGQYAFIEGTLESGTQIVANGLHKVAANISVTVVKSIRTRSL